VGEPLVRAKAQLEKIMPADAAQHLLALTHGQPPPTYVLVYNDFIKGAILLKYMGNWDFRKVEEFHKLQKTDKEKAAQLLPSGKDAYRNFLWWVAGGEPYVEEESYETGRSGNFAFFGNGLSLNLATLECDLVSEKKNLLAKPTSIFYMDGDVFRERVFDHPTINASVLLIQNEGKYSSVIAEREFAGSLAFRMYYLKGKGLEYFKPFTQVEDVLTQTRIYVYEVDWKKFLADEGYN
jgi:hypothetical protein